MTSTSRFLALDGLDGAGKSTQLALLAEWLRAGGHRVVTCIDPGGTPLGGRLRQVLLDERNDISPMAEALLFMASRAELLQRVIRPALAAGCIVLSDRYLLATIVYQGYAGGLDVDMLWRLGDLAANGIHPDLYLILDLPVEMSQQRRGRDPDRMELRANDYHEKVRRGFLTEARRRPEQIRIVDARESIDAIQARLREEVSRVLGSNPRP